MCASRERDKGLVTDEATAYIGGFILWSAVVTPLAEIASGRIAGGIVEASMTATSSEEDIIVVIVIIIIVVVIIEVIISVNIVRTV